METYLLKFSACLLIFLLVYVLLLERQNMHRFKRLYLLGAFAIALIIPVLTITHYIEPVIQDFEITSDYAPIDTPYIETPKDKNTSVSLETVLWSIYGIGVLLFSIRFVFNLINLYRKISHSERMYNRSFIYVLLKDYRIPHSFFRYIFLNKQKFENKDIPREVLLHEETHAKQLHSLDIIILELLQILFWFHPLVYILKHHVKLNHEFLADEAVLNNCSDTITYQQILLQFSSNTQEYQLSSAINYSSIKKRFTVMKTQTSKTRIWFSSLLLLPVCAILFYSFAEREYVQKENTKLNQAIAEELEKAEKLNVTYINENSDKLLGIWYNKEKNITLQFHLQNGGLLCDVKEADNTHVRYHPKTNDTGWWFTYKNQPLSFKIDNKTLKDSRGLTYIKTSNIATSQHLKIDIDEAGILKINNQITSYNDFEVSVKKIKRDLSPKEIKKLITVELFSKLKQHERLLKKITDQLLFNGIDNIRVYKFYDPYAEKEPKKTASKEEVEAYNTWAKDINDKNKAAKANKNNEYAIIKLKELNYHKAIYDRMTDTQRENAQQFPDAPPPIKPHPGYGKKEKGGPNVGIISHSSIINPVKIIVKADNSLVLNGQSIDNEELESQVKKINIHLNSIDHRDYVMASFIVEKNTSRDYAKTLQKRLQKVNIWSSCMSYNENKAKINDTKKLNGFYDGLTLNEAKAKQQEVFDSPVDIDKKIDSINNSSSPWKISVGTASVEYINDKGKSTGKINLTSKNTIQTKELPKIYINNKVLENPLISLTKEEVKKLKITLSKGKIISFRFKITGVRTEIIEGNTITKTSLKNLETTRTGDDISLFDITDGNGSKLPPIVIELKE
ncbi:M56 family metallopeptidase [uncultured Winogradskyella sp.]|uniref:M56 family metallopeptidase n=1 Tax=uncultured Winogradskyella sp. TaxID=395353 RepID=UPI0026110162|nr:M56 family metallopeptidase [uncultured Winogradskyella sp.]